MPGALRMIRVGIRDTGTDANVRSKTPAAATGGRGHEERRTESAGGYP